MRAKQAQTDFMTTEPYREILTLAIKLADEKEAYESREADRSRLRTLTSGLYFDGKDSHFVHYVKNTSAVGGFRSPAGEEIGDAVHEEIFTHSDKNLSSWKALQRFLEKDPRSFAAREVSTLIMDAEQKLKSLDPIECAEATLVVQPALDHLKAFLLRRMGGNGNENASVNRPFSALHIVVPRRTDVVPTPAVSQKPESTAAVEPPTPKEQSVQVAEVTTEIEPTPAPEPPALAPLPAPEPVVDPMDALKRAAAKGNADALDIIETMKSGNHGERWDPIRAARLLDVI